MKSIRIASRRRFQAAVACKCILRCGLGLLIALLLLPRTAAAAGPSGTATTLALSAPQVAQGNAVTLTASVSGAGPVTVGQVNFCDAGASHCTDIHLLGTAQLTSAGTAAFRFIPGVGSHSYRAVFLGTGAATASSSDTAALDVSGTYPTITSIARSGAPGNYSLTATIAGAGPNLPTGTVSFADTSNGNDTLASVNLEAGTTTLSSQSVWTSRGDDAYGVGVGDFNGDGKPDLAVPNLHNNTVSVLLGNGDGTFTPGATLPTGSNPIFVAVGDFNGDGKADLAVVNLSSSSVTVLLGNGDGTFTTGSTMQTGTWPQNAFTGDFNGDGIADLAVPNYGSANVTVLLGNGDGTFTAAGDVPTGSGPAALALGDINGDGKTDMVVADYDASAITVLLGAGDGTFTQAGTLTGSTNPTSVVMGDFNNDGRLDLALANYGGSNVSVLLGVGDGTFATEPSIPTGSEPTYITVADFSGSGKGDLAVITQSTSNLSDNAVTILVGNGDGTFTAIAPVSNGYLPMEIAAADVNGDGIPDVVTANDDSGQVTVMLTHRLQTVAASASRIAPAGNGTHLVQASYSGDAIYTGGSSGTTGLTAQPVTTALTLAASPAGAAYGQPVTLTATLSPYSTQGHGTDAEPITFYNGSTQLGTGILSGGAVILHVNALPVGVGSLVASFGGDSDFAASTSVPLSYAVTGAAPTIAFAIPDHTYGDPSFAVSATSNSSGAITYTVVSGPADVAGSTLTVTGAGTVGLRAAQAADGNYSAATQSTSFTVHAAAPAIAFAVADHTYGDPSFAISATSNSSGAIAYTVVSGPASLAGSTLTLTGTGTVVLQAAQAADGNYATATQSTRLIIHAAAPAIAFAVADHTYGDPPFTVSATSNSSGAIAYTVVSGPASLAGSTLTLTGAGTVVLQAAQAADGNYAASTQSTSFHANPASFTLTSDSGDGASTGAAATVRPGASATYAFLLTPQAGATFPQAVTLSVSGLPPGATYSFSPATIPAHSAAAGATLTVQTATTVAELPPSALGKAGLALLLLPFAGSRRLRRSARGLPVFGLVCGLLSLGAMFSLIGCGAVSTLGQAQHSYSITVTATSGSLTQSTQVTLMEQ